MDKIKEETEHKSMRILNGKEDALSSEVEDDLISDMLDPCLVSSEV
jgi:hypothetical protein